MLNGKWISDAVQGWAHPNSIIDYEEIPVEENLRVALITVPMSVAKPYSKRKGQDAKKNGNQGNNDGQLKKKKWGQSNDIDWVYPEKLFDYQWKTFRMTVSVFFKGSRRA